MRVDARGVDLVGVALMGIDLVAPNLRIVVVHAGFVARCLCRAIYP